MNTVRPGPYRCVAISTCRPNWLRIRGSPCWASTTAPRFARVTGKCQYMPGRLARISRLRPGSAAKRKIGSAAPSLVSSKVQVSRELQPHFGRRLIQAGIARDRQDLQPGTLRSANAQRRAIARLGAEQPLRTQFARYVNQSAAGVADEVGDQLGPRGAETAHVGIEQDQNVILVEFLLIIRQAADGPMADMLVTLLRPIAANWRTPGRCRAAKRCA